MTMAGMSELLKAADSSKDQSYFLHRLTQSQLAPVLFPLGDARKRDVRAIARNAKAFRRGTKKGLDRHLLHRRAPVSRFSRPLFAARAGTDRDA